MIHTLFPPSCLSCRDLVTTDNGLCASCWKDLPLISGPVCRACGVPLLAEEDDKEAICDACVETPRPWSQGRAAMQHTGLARKFVSGLKHYDRYDFAPACAAWMADAAAPLMTSDTVFAPVPLHWSHLVKRRYNQAAVLAFALGQRCQRPAVLDLLIRNDRSDGDTERPFDARLAALRASIHVNSKRQDRLAGQPILLVDDTMATGATLMACSEACLAAGASRVDVVTLAREAKGP